MLGVLDDVHDPKHIHLVVDSVVLRPGCWGVVLARVFVVEARRERCQRRRKRNRARLKFKEKRAPRY